MDKSRGKHEERLQEILDKPYKVGLHNVVLISKEVRLYDGNRLIGEPDIMAYDLDKGWVFGEYKCNPSNIEKAFGQNSRTYSHLVKYNVPIDKAEFIIIHSDLKVV